MTITLEIDTKLDPGQAFEFIQRAVEDRARLDFPSKLEITGGSAQCDNEDTGDMCRHGKLICVICDPEATDPIVLAQIRELSWKPGRN